MEEMTRPSATVRETGFDGLVIGYDDRVLAPRAWTVVQSAWAAELSAGPGPPILELFSGVGHIGLAAARRSGRRLVQVDADPVACEHARANASRAAMADRVSVRCSDVARALRASPPTDLVLVDPPYLPTLHLERVPGDPHHAVDGGPDGLDPARRALDALAAWSRPTRVLLQLGGAAQVHRLCAELRVAVAPLEVRTWAEDRAVVLLAVSGG